MDGEYIMKQRIIDWFRADIRAGWGEWIDDANFIKVHIDKMAVKRGTALYKHLFEQPDLDVEEYHKED